MVKKLDTNKARLNRHKRVRGKVTGTAECPRLNVFRSLQHIYAQLIDDVAGVTLVSASTVEKDFTEYGGNMLTALANYWLKEPLKRISKIAYSTEAVISITAESKSSPKAPVKAA